MANKVFISHASGDYRNNDGTIIPGNAISLILQVLDDNNIDRWIDETGLVSSKGWCQQIEEAMNECNIFLYISSEKANSSANTANEIAYAIKRQMHIIPFKLDESPYHKDISLNLIRIHFLKYYEDRKKALTDLVSTIRSINTDKLIIDTSVKIGEILNEEKINGKLLSELVISFFNAKDIISAVECFKSLINVLSCESEKGFNVLNSYVQKLEKLAQERNYTVRQARIGKLISDIKDNSSETQRRVRIMIILLKMYLYLCLNDIQEVVYIQNEISDVSFELKFVERHSENINEAANLAIRAAAFIGGAVALFTGKGGSAAKGAMVGSTKGDTITIVKSPDKIEFERKAFETLKAVSLALKF